MKYLLGTFRFFQMIKGRLKHREKEDDSVIVATSFCDTNIYSLRYHKNFSRTNLKKIRKQFCHNKKLT